jgi:parvulin-like peptidyl-prolyl isomerase
VNAFRKLSDPTDLCVVAGLLFFSVLLQVPPLAAASPAAPAQKKTDIYSGIFPEVVAKVNGNPIYGSDLEVEIRKELIPIGSPKWSDLREDYRGQLLYSILNSLINSKLLYDQAVSEGIRTSDSEVQDEYLKATQNFRSDEALEDYYSQLKIDSTKAIDDLHKSLIIKKYVDAAITSRIAVTPEEISKYYAEHPDEFKHPDIVRTSLIMIESDGSPESDARAKKQAQDILARIEKGEDFAGLAMKYSASSSAPQGGDNGYTSREGLKPEYAEVAFSLPVGQTRMIKTNQGYEIIKVTDKKKEGISSLKESEEPLREFIANEKTQSELTRLINKLRDQSDIEFLIPVGPTLNP